MSGLTDMLDQLDEAREKATPGPWKIRDDGVTVEIEGGDRESVRDKHGFHDADAALIVAAVNALPQLTVAIRAVLDRHHPVSQNVYAATPLEDPVDVCAIDTTTTWPCQTVRALTAAIAAPVAQASGTEGRR